MDCDKKGKMDTPPPLPPEEPPKAPRPPLPPPSIQTSNRDHERLDFENDASGDPSNTCCGPPAKRPRLGCESQVEEDKFGEDEGPDTLLGSGLAAELLEEGEIFDSASILSRNGSWASSKSFSTSQDRDDSQATGSPPTITDTCSRTELEQNVGEVDALESNDTQNSPDEPCIEVEEPDDEVHTMEEPDDEVYSVDGRGVHLSDPHDIQLADSKRSLKPLIPSQGQEEFAVIDDLESDGGDGEQSEHSNSDFDADSDDMLYDEDEIDALLDEEMEKDGQRTRPSGEGAALEQKEKVVLVDRSNDPFDILPENWVMVTHNSGMPLYLHKKSRVCTLSKPYFLGPSSARKHDIPVSAIPCLQYQRALDKRQDEQPSTVSEACPNQMNNNDANDEPELTSNGQETVKVTAPTDTSLPNIGVKIETAKDHEKLNSLGVMEVREYCQKLFHFQTITVKRFRTWKDRRKHTNLLRKVSRPSLPSSTKLIRCAIPAEKDSKNMKRKEFVLNPAGKSDICILHEYVQQAMRIQPRYVFEELQNTNTPFGATVIISGEKYGSGYSSSKKGAKLEAAKQTLSILIPEMTKLKNEDKEEPATSDLTLFDTIKIEDPRVTELCNKAGQPGPFPVLCVCLKRNYGVGDTQVQMEMKAIKHQKSEFIMKVGKHEANVICKNKREGKQQAAQAILQKMHPHIHTWGSLLRLYDRSIIIQQNKETESVIDLQIKSKSLPNRAILNKLKDEMRKLHSKHSEVQSSIKGRLQLPSSVGFASTNLGSVDL